MSASLDDVSDALNISTRRVTQLAKAGIIPREARGEYDLTNCLRSYVRYLQQAMASKATMGDDGELATSRGARVDLVRYKAEREKFELAKARGEVIAISDHEQIISSLIIETKARIMSVGPRVAPTLIGETSRNMIQARIEAECKVALMQLAQRVPSDSVATDPDPTPPQPKRTLPRKTKRVRSSKKKKHTSKAV